MFCNNEYINRIFVSFNFFRYLSLTILSWLFPRISLRNKNDAGIKISFSGVCSGGLCEEGSYLTDNSGKSLPVPRGWQNPSCFQCKYWLTGSDFLLGQQLEFNQLTEALHNKAKDLESLRKEWFYK